MINKAYLNSPLYLNYKEDVGYNIRVPAVIYVPGRLLIAIVFPKQADAEVNNKFPHMTLMRCGKLPGEIVNSVMMTTCKDYQKFEGSYYQVKTQKNYGSSVDTSTVQLTHKNNKVEVCEAYFITFDYKK